MNLQCWNSEPDEESKASKVDVKPNIVDYDFVESGSFVKEDILDYKDKTNGLQTHSPESVTVLSDDDDEDYADDDDDDDYDDEDDDDNDSLDKISLETWINKKTWQTSKSGHTKHKNDYPKKHKLSIENIKTEGVSVKYEDSTPLSDANLIPYANFNTDIPKEFTHNVPVGQKPKKRRIRNKGNNPNYRDMVDAAILSKPIGLPKLAVAKYIITNYNVPCNRVTKSIIYRTLNKGIETGRLYFKHSKPGHYRITKNFDPSSTQKILPKNKVPVAKPIVKRSTYSKCGISTRSSPEGYLGKKEYKTQAKTLEALKLTQSENHMLRAEVQQLNSRVRQLEIQLQLCSCQQFDYQNSIEMDL